MSMTHYNISGTPAALRSNTSASITHHGSAASLPIHYEYPAMFYAAQASAYRKKCTMPRTFSRQEFLHDVSETLGLTSNVMLYKIASEILAWPPEKIFFLSEETRPEDKNIVQRAVDYCSNFLERIIPAVQEKQKEEDKAEEEFNRRFNTLVGKKIASRAVSVASSGASYFPLLATASPLPRTPLPRMLSFTEKMLSLSDDENHKIHSLSLTNESASSVLYTVTLNQITKEVEPFV